MLTIDNPVKMPDPSLIERIEEPFVTATIITPTDYIGNIMALVTECRGIHKDMQYIDKQRVQLHYDLPLSEIVFNFYDKLKSISRGYASFDYELKDFRDSKMVKVDILVNAEPVDALSFIVHQDKARMPRQGHHREAEGHHPAPAVQDTAPGGHRRLDHRAGEHLGRAQGRHRQVLRRGHHPEAQAPGKAERREKADEA